MLPDTFSHPIVGPALMIRGHLLKWEGAPSSPGVKNNVEPVDLRVTFESEVDEQVTSHLSMENIGTTAIYFSWEVCSCTGIYIHMHTACIHTYMYMYIHVYSMYMYMYMCACVVFLLHKLNLSMYWLQHLPQPNPLQTVQAGDTQRFYFDTRGGLCVCV